MWLWWTGRLYQPHLGWLFTTQAFSSSLWGHAAGTGLMCFAVHLSQNWPRLQHILASFINVASPGCYMLCELQPHWPVFWLQMFQVWKLFRTPWVQSSWMPIWCDASPGSGRCQWAEGLGTCGHIRSQLLPISDLLLPLILSQTQLTTQIFEMEWLEGRQQVFR